MCRPSSCTEQTAGCICYFCGAQVADIADVVRQRADALMLSGESAVGAYPEKALAVLRQVSTRIEEWCRHAPYLPMLVSASMHSIELQMSAMQDAVLSQVPLQ